MTGTAGPTVPQFLASLPPERRKVMAAVRKLVRANVPAGYREAMGYGMIAWTIPLKRYPDTYNGQPLCYVALAAHKTGYSLYLMSAYQDSKEMAFLERAFKTAGKRFDMGKSCLRFRAIEDLPLDAIAKVVAGTSVDDYIARYERIRRLPRR